MMEDLKKGLEFAKMIQVMIPTQRDIRKEKHILDAIKGYEDQETIKGYSEQKTIEYDETLLPEFSKYLSILK